MCWVEEGGLEMGFESLGWGMVWDLHARSWVDCELKLAFFGIVC